MPNARVPFTALPEKLLFLLAVSPILPNIVLGAILLLQTVQPTMPNSMYVIYFAIQSWLFMMSIVFGTGYLVKIGSIKLSGRTFEPRIFLVNIPLTIGFMLRILAPQISNNPEAAKPMLADMDPSLRIDLAVAGYVIVLIASILIGFYLLQQRRRYEEQRSAVSL